jgi:pimeloyl-ACP methyl ester carboxylesterase
MATFALIHGAGGRASYWDLVRAELTAAGHDSVAMDLPCDDDAAGLAEYAQAVVDAIGHRQDDLVVVAQSLGGLTAPLVAERLPVDLIILVTAMIPRPGETGGEWWANTGHAQAVAAQGLPDDSEATLFTHDVPAEVLAAAGPPRNQSGTPMGEVWPLAAWPDVPTRFLLCTEDRFFPPEWMRGIVRERLAIEPEEIPGGHCAFLSQPQPLAAALLRLGDGA